MAQVWKYALLMAAFCFNATTGYSQESETPTDSKSRSPFNLADTEFYSPVAPKQDEGGLLIAGTNSTETIRKCKSINGLTIEELERRMRPNSDDATGSTAGFLGEKEKLLDVFADDNDFVLQSGVTHRDLAIPLLQITHRAVKEGLSREVEFEHAGIKWQVRVEASRGFQLSPFDDGTKTNLDVELTNLSNKQTLKFSGLVPLMVERYGFYEGKGTPYRVEPAQIMNVLQLPAKKVPQSP